MKIVFAGPSIHGQEIDAPNVAIRPPVRLGDVLAAVQEGVEVIGIIDGYFEGQVAVWHKEILFALSQGVAVLGAASMGALRAAECAPFGMRPVGSIARAYANGEIEADADVAVVHGPAELGYPPLNEAMVDVRATMAHLRALDLVSADQENVVTETAARLFFKQRTTGAIFNGLQDGEKLKALYKANRVGQKTRDALELIAEVEGMPTGHIPVPTDWTFEASAPWMVFMEAREGPLH